MKRIPFFLLLLLLTVACSGPQHNVSSDDIVILYDNDVHCSVEGYPAMAALRKAMLEVTPNVTVVSSGDFVQGGNLGAVSKGAYIIDIMNRTGYDLATLGNHEFDYGMEALALNGERFNGKILDCNLIDLQAGKRMYSAYTIVDYGGKRVAFIGISTPYSFASSSPSFFTDENGEYIYSLSLDTIYDTVQNMVSDARLQGADYVVVLSHLGDQLTIDVVNSHALIASTTGIDVVLDGHAHNVIERRILKNKEGDEVLMTSTGSHFENIGMLKIAKDGTITSKLIPVSKCKKRDAEVEALVDSINTVFDQIGKRPVGSSDVVLPAKDANQVWIVRNMQQAIGDFCSDALRLTTGADIAFVGGGSIRAGLPQGPITYGDLYAVYPFNNRVCTAQVTGKVLRDALEFAYCAVPESFGGYQHVSGLKAVVNANIESPVVVDGNKMFVSVDGPRRVSNIMVLNAAVGRYENLEDDRVYTIAADSYRLLEKGDGFTMFEGCDVTDLGVLDVSSLEDYIVKYLGGVIPASYGKTENRVKFLLQKN